MREFFRGWKRKVGVVTLMLACLLAVGWVRSLYVEDDWQPPAGTIVDGYYEDTVHQVFRSSPFGLTWQRTESLNGDRRAWKSVWGTAPAQVAALNEEKHEKRIADILKWRWRRCGFDFCVAEDDETRYTRRRVPYWSIVIPLTLISAYLLLGEPRASNAQKAKDVNNQER